MLLAVAALAAVRLHDAQDCLERMHRSGLGAVGITVQYVTLPHGDLTAQVTQAATAGSGALDVAMVSPNEIQSGWATEGYVQLPEVRSALTVDDELYALPFNAESSVLHYREDLFAAAGLTVPDAPTWEDVRGFALTLNSPTMRGLDLRFAPEAGGLSPFTTVVNSFGACWFDENWNPQLLSAIATFGSGLEAMQKGRRAMWLDLTVAAGLLSNPLISSVSDTVGYVEAPTQGCSNGSAWLCSWSLGL